MMKIYVINLVDSVERRNRVSERLNELDLKHEFVPAVDGRQEPHPLFERYNDKKRVLHRRKELSGGELGCYASHFMLWEKCLDLNHPIVVMEDDAKISDTFSDALALSSKLLERIDYVRLAGNSLDKCPYYKVRSFGGFDLCAHVRGPAGTLCYVITPKAAQKFIEHSKEWFLAVDDFIDRYWSHGELCFSLMPFPVEPWGGRSTIPRNKKDKRITSVLSRELYRRLELIRRSRYQRVLKETSSSLMGLKL